ncbi:MAG: MBL fold metallo-hydrolase [Planctomycetota bacterium]|nr:MAG: MBL fold metallo-hydrolase [Planctomycetota bacterium]
MHCQILSSGSRGNATLIRAGELRVLVDAGLPLGNLRERLEAARLPLRGIDHILVTHGHLDHARSAGALAKRQQATVHCAEAIMRHRAVRRAPRLATIRIGRDNEVIGEHGEVLLYRPVLLPHDCDPTVAYRLEHEGGVVAIVTDLGVPDATAARRLRGAHVLVLEFNHDPDMLAAGPYPPSLKRRVGGDRGHLSNEQACVMLERLAGPDLHTLVLAHLSHTNNTPGHAVDAAFTTLQRLGMTHVEILVASQDEIGPNLKVS